MNELPTTPIPWKEKEFDELNLEDACLSKPIEWRLPRNRDVDTLAAAVEMIECYRARSEIEMMFNVPKNAARSEERSSVPLRISSAL